MFRLKLGFYMHVLKDSIKKGRIFFRFVFMMASGTVALECL